MSSWSAARSATRACRCTGSRTTSTSTVAAISNDQIPPANFWAAADHAFPADQAALADAAHDRGLYRDAAQLHKNAAARGNLHAVSYLSNPPDLLADAPPRPLGYGPARLLEHPGAVPSCSTPAGVGQSDR